MAKITRRRFLQVSGMSVAALSAARVPVFGQARRRVLVIGGGWGGATAAKYIRLTDPSIEVTLLEPNKEFISCPFSNLVVAGVESLKGLTLNYNGLRKHGVKIRHEAAAAIEPDKKRVRVGRDHSNTTG
ncbi:MAG: FAD-dependent oxidoreductase [Candidatus Binatota bacterium]|nr:FAD-dependent oxidoreductase [Candidatus Binatota bacterium]